MTRPQLASLSETADRARIVARMRLDNARTWAATVAEASGLMSVEYVVAEAVVRHERHALIATYGEGLAAASGLDGVPVERTS